MDQIAKRAATYAVITLFLISCQGEEGPAGFNGLIRMTTESQGANCEGGGVKLDSGADTDRDGVLSDDEVTSTAYLCNGINGNNTLANVINELPGVNCEGGGIKLDSGVDTDRDGVLDSDEVTSTAYLCNGINSNNTLTKVINELSGANCENGGLRIATGIDDNRNGNLDDSEITSTSYVCNGINGNTSLVTVLHEPVGENCPGGGTRILAGVDLDRDGILDPTEIHQTSFICTNGRQMVVLDIQVAFEWRLATTTWSQSSIKDEILSDFDVDYYQSFDEIYFSVQFDRSPAETSDSLGIRLFSYTNNAAVNGSDVWSTIPNSILAGNPVLKTFKSGNIIESFPQEKSNFGMQIRKQGNIPDMRSISIHSAELVLIKEE
jgi:hypothetical protein